MLARNKTKGSVSLRLKSGKSGAVERFDCDPGQNLELTPAMVRAAEKAASKGSPGALTLLREVFEPVDGRPALSLGLASVAELAPKPPLEDEDEDEPPARKAGTRKPVGDVTAPA